MDSLWFKKRKRQTLHSLGVGFAFFAILYILTRIFASSLCPLKNVFGISCLGCGMTRGFISILHLDFKAAYAYNVLSIPLFAGIIIYSSCFFIDIIFNKNLVLKIETQLAKKYMYLLYALILIAAVILKHA